MKRPVSPHSLPPLVWFGGFFVVCGVWALKQGSREGSPYGRRLNTTHTNTEDGFRIEKTGRKGGERERGQPMHACWISRRAKAAGHIRLSTKVGTTHQRRFHGDSQARGWLMKTHPSAADTRARRLATMFACATCDDAGESCITMPAINAMTHSLAF